MPELVVPEPDELWFLPGRRVTCRNRAGGSVEDFTGGTRVRELLEAYKAGPLFGHGVRVRIDHGFPPEVRVWKRQTDAWTLLPQDGGTAHAVLHWYTNHVVPRRVAQRPISDNPGLST